MTLETYMKTFKKRPSALARYAEVSNETVRCWLRGKHMPSRPHLRVIAVWTEGHVMPSDFI